MSMRFKGGIISATPPTITPPVGGEGGTASGSWTLQQQFQNASIWPKPIIARELWAWSLNDFGQLGLNDTVNRSSPVQVGSDINWSNVACGYKFTTAVKKNGTLWSWGRNNYNYQLGLGDTISRSSPVQVGALTNWSSVASGRLFSLALKTDGTLWSWGDNAYGVLGDFQTSRRSSPIQIGSDTNWAQVSAGRDSSFAVKTNGTLWSWGRNNYGMLGQNISSPTPGISSPVQVGALTNWAQVSSGRDHFIAVKTDGTLWSCGRGSFGATGLGNAINVSSPVQVGALTTWSLCSSGDNFSGAITTSGSLWMWGVNNTGQLGIGISGPAFAGTWRSSPVQVGALNDWSKISCTNTTTYSIKTNGTLWAWGYGSNGNLGSNDTAPRSSPVQVGSLTTWLALHVGSQTRNALAIKS